VFSITPSGKETVLHSFGIGSDGKLPEAGLIALNGTLYGTTVQGGASSCASIGCGTVFSIATSGKEKVLHSFSGSDGAYPQGGLTDVNGTLYGTTSDGGAHGSACGSTPCGTVFSITKSGKETVLHSFSGPDGAYPWAGLTNVNGTLYGTTVDGGAGGSNCSYAGGCGTVFSITTSGKEMVLHNFGNFGDGAYPFADLVNVNGTLYGTTPYAGRYGFGTLFSLKL
jgi:uncharacterized repeat protein (TIGR03803 family)